MRMGVCGRVDLQMWGHAKADDCKEKEKEKTYLAGGEHEHAGKHVDVLACRCG